MASNRLFQGLSPQQQRMISYIKEDPHYKHAMTIESLNKLPQGKASKYTFDVHYMYIIPEKTSNISFNLYKRNQEVCLQRRLIISTNGEKIIYDLHGNQVDDSPNLYLFSPYLHEFKKLLIKEGYLTERTMFAGASSLGFERDLSDILGDENVKSAFISTLQRYQRHAVNPNKLKLLFFLERDKSDYYHYLQLEDNEGGSYYDLWDSAELKAALDANKIYQEYLQFIQVIAPKLAIEATIKSQIDAKENLTIEENATQSLFLKNEMS